MTTNRLLAIAIALTLSIYGFLAYEQDWLGLGGPQEVTVQAPPPMVVPVEPTPAPAPVAEPKEPAFHISVAPADLKAMTQQEVRDLIALALFGKVFNVSGDVLGAMADKLIPKVVEKPKPKEAKPAK